MIRSTRQSPVVLPNVIVPVHDAFDYVVECLDALAATAPDARVVVIDDASTDARVRPMLEAWCSGSPRRRLLTFDRNAGFVGAANRGAELSDGDIVLLNSDTRVTPGWLEALGRCLASDRRIATATPWSNNGEIVSIPGFCEVNPVPADTDRIADCLHEAGPAQYPELPTAVGFCMAVSRRAITELGLFDEQAFGRGYGEENDFSLRAADAGWRNVLCDDAYVVHHGGRSFAPLGLRPDRNSMARLLSKHPDYERLVSEWIGRDPLRKRRVELLRACPALASVRMPHD